ncbi:MAG: hypothetical protein ABIC95_03625 [archaeon]
MEASWEVCNKVGGIYTVVSSKAHPLIEIYGDDYMLVGPYFYEKAKSCFEERAAPPDLKPICRSLEQEGINVHFGTWLIKGKPTAILLDFSGYTKNKDMIKTELWDKFGIDSLNSDYYDFDEPIVWSYCVGKLIEHIKALHPEKRIVAQFHEWMSAGGLLYLKSRQIRVGTVFTTHATMLGRTLSGKNIDIYDHLNDIDPVKEAYRYGIHPKHLTEMAAAKHAGAFTTVSEITGLEAEHFLGKKPDVLLPNGLDIEKFPTFEELSINHRTTKMKIQEFLMAYFLPYYPLEIEDALIMFTVGRPEFHVKGFDLLIDSLAKLNERLKSIPDAKPVVAFFFVPAAIKRVKPEILENKTFFTDIKEYVSDRLRQIENRIIEHILTRKDSMDIFTVEEREEMLKKLLRLAKTGDPPVCTHDLWHPETDAFLNEFAKKGLTNKKDDKVKIIYYPLYLAGADGLLDLDYYEMIQGTHLGVFPSMYEPWGYTPLETAALGVMSITTDLAGYGRYIQNELREGTPGLAVVRRSGKSYDESCYDLTEAILAFTRLSRADRVKNKIEARRIASMADWKILIGRYLEAHSLALKEA